MPQKRLAMFAGCLKKHKFCLLQKWLRTSVICRNIISYPGDSAGLEAIYSDSTQDFYSKKIQENAADEQTEKGMKLQRAKREGRQRKTNKNSFGELYFVYVEIK